jgi:hypothetical protein
MRLRTIVENRRRQGEYDPFGLLEPGEPSPDDLAETEKWMQDEGLNDLGDEPLDAEWVDPPAQNHAQAADPAPTEPLEEIVKRMDAASIIDRGLCDTHFPFIYVPDTQRKLFIGKFGKYHNNLISELIRSQHPEAKVVDATYHNETDALVAVGRVGVGIKRYEKDYQVFDIPDDRFGDVQVVSFYVKYNTNAEVVIEAVKALLANKAIEPAAYLVYGNEVKKVSEVVGGGRVANADEESLRKGKLQVALHLGAWPDGRRLTPQERKQIEQELGMASRPVLKHPMQKHLEQNRLLTPGARWWTPTSESRHRLRDIR